MESQILFYVDLLGFSEAIQREDDGRRQALTDLLNEMAKQRGPFEVEEVGADGSRGFKMRPQISTFSDLIAISYRTQGLSEFVAGSIVLLSFSSAERLISTLALEALKLDLLIRGGATIGPLEHTMEMVAGKALVDAYKLESQDAIYPRIVLSTELSAQIESDFGSLFLLRDWDGVAHLNYFRRLLLFGEKQNKASIAWLPEVRYKVTENIARLKAEDRSKELSKWVWFENTIDKVCAETQNAALK